MRSDAEQALAKRIEQQLLFHDDKLSLCDACLDAPLEDFDFGRTARTTTTTVKRAEEPVKMVSMATIERLANPVRSSLAKTRHKGCTASEESEARRALESSRWSGMSLSLSLSRAPLDPMAAPSTAAAAKQRLRGTTVVEDQPTFTPKVNEASRRILESSGKDEQSAEQRSVEWTSKREERIKALRAIKAERELEGCTFTPAMSSTNSARSEGNPVARRGSGEFANRLERGRARWQVRHPPDDRDEYHLQRYTGKPTRLQPFRLTNHGFTESRPPPTGLLRESATLPSTPSVVGSPDSLEIVRDRDLLDDEELLAAAMTL